MLEEFKKQNAPQEKPYLGVAVKLIEALVGAGFTLSVVRNGKALLFNSSAPTERVWVHEDRASMHVGMELFVEVKFFTRTDPDKVAFLVKEILKF